MEINHPRQVWQLKFEGEWPTAVAFWGNHRRLAAANQAGQIFVWELPETPPELNPAAKEPTPPDYPPVRRLDGHTNAITHLVCTPDGKSLISASLDRSVRCWELEVASTGMAQVVLDVQDRQRRARSQAGAEKEAILNAPGQTVQIATCAKVLEGHRDWVTSLGMSRDGRRVISGDSSSQVIVWDRASQAAISNWRGQAWNGIVAAALSSDGQTALVSEYGYKRDDFDIPAAGLKLWHVADGREKLDLLKLQFPQLDANATSYSAAQVWRKFVANGLIAADFSPDGKLLAVGQGGETDSGQVHLFDVESGKLLRSISGHRYGVCDVIFSADSRYVLSSGRDTMVRICEAADGKEVATLGKERGGQFKDWLHAIDISPDQQYVAAADIAGMVHVWQLQS